MLASNPDQTSIVWTVSALTADLKSRIESRYQRLSVTGELSGVTRHASGHVYFTLKDRGSQLSGIMWRSAAQRLYFQPRDGMDVLCRGSLTVYEPRGSYQLLVQEMMPRGEGALRQAFEEMKRRLFEEGLFDESRKKPIPQFPQRVGIITSPTGAAIRDMMSVVRRRHAGLHLTVIPAVVQGEGAVASLIQALKDAVAYGGFDVLVLARGGGSIEDLWCFNEEEVARAIASCPLPVISAVGHEVDVTIADYVADARAATPSVAAEMLTPLREDLMTMLKSTHESLYKAVDNQLRFRLRAMRESVFPVHMQSVQGRLMTWSQRVGERYESIARAVDRHTERLGWRVNGLKEGIEASNPQRVLARGFAWVRSRERFVPSSSELNPGDPITVVFHDGSIHAEVTHVQITSH